jgi:hypothetical protein
MNSKFQSQADNQTIKPFKNSAIPKIFGVPKSHKGGKFGAR